MRGDLRALLILAATLLAAAACKDEEKAGGKILTRSRDAAPVVVVHRTAPGAGRSAEEEEPNGSAEEASELPAPATGVGTLDGQDDVDFYRIEAKADGFMTARLGGIDGVDLILDLLDADGERLARSDRGPAKVEEGIPNYRVKQGETYLLVVREYSKRRKKPRTGESPSYQLAVEVLSELNELHEQEPNESADAALEVLLGDEAFGHIGWAGDQDLWKLSLEGFSEGHSLDVSVAAVEGVTLKLEILDEGGKVLVAREAEKNRPIFARNLVAIPGQSHHFARLSAERSNPSQVYVIKPTSRMLADGEEREPNDESESATPLRPETEPEKDEGIAQGFLVAGDRDYYRFDAGAAAVSLELEVRPASGDDLVLELRAGGTTHKASDGKAGDAERLSAVSVGAGQTAWVRITGTASGAEPEPYELRWRAAAPQTEEPDESEFDDFDDF